jgi:hypothetical protein
LHVRPSTFENPPSLFPTLGGQAKFVDNLACDVRSVMPVHHDRFEIGSNSMLIEHQRDNAASGSPSRRYSRRVLRLVVRGGEIKIEFRIDQNQTPNSAEFKAGVERECLTGNVLVGCVAAQPPIGAGPQSNRATQAHESRAGYGRTACLRVPVRCFGGFRVVANDASVGVSCFAFFVEM